MVANAFENTSLVTKLSMASFHNYLELGTKVNKQFSSDFTNKVGNAISVRRPVMFTSASGATLGTAIGIEDTVATLTLDQRHHVHFAILSQDMTLEIDQIKARYIEPAMYELAQKVESTIADEYKNIGNFSGTPGTTPSNFLAVANAKAVLSKLGVPSDKQLCGFFDPNASVALADGLKGVFPSEIAKKAIERAQVGMYAGVMLYENQSLKSHTVGIVTGTPLVNGASQNVTYATAGAAWTQSLITDGWTNSTSDMVLAGDVITLAGVNSVNRRTREDTGDLATFSITADAASGASTGPLTMTITPPIITSGPYQTCTAAPADDAIITVKTGTASTAYRQNLIFHPDAITLAFANLDLPGAGADGARETYENTSIRAVRQYAIGTDITTFRFDVLFGVKSLNPDMAVRVTS